jgi:hypothetical protein
VSGSAVSSAEMAAPTLGPTASHSPGQDGAPSRKKEVRLSDDRGYSGDEQERYVLRWESLPQNQDQPRNPPLPDPGPLEVYFLRL